MAQQGIDHFSSQESARETARKALMPVPHEVAGPGWDSFISVMRLVLPVTAAILGSITILWPFINDTEVSFTLSKDEVAKGDGQIRMTNLRYVGTDAENRLFELEAASGLQDTPDAPRIRLTDIHAEMALKPELKARVSARTGIYRMQDSTLSLVGGVHVESGNGYVLDMAGAEVDLKAHKARGQGDIIGQSKLGSLKAGQIEIYVDDEEAIFSGGVHINIIPKRP